jgi:hypothetical protein
LSVSTNTSPPAPLMRTARIAARARDVKRLNR